jgi:hypothetical protein
VRARVTKRQAAKLTLDEKVNMIAEQLADSLIKEWSDLSLNEKVNGFKAIFGYKMAKDKSATPAQTGNAFERYARQVMNSEEEDDDAEE